MSEQLDISFGETLKQRGIERAVMGAGDGWTDRAYSFLRLFLQQNEGSFLMEQVRVYAYENGLSRPNSNRAWGAISVRAMKEGLIKRIGTGVVSNPQAHKCYASMYVKA